MSLIYAIPHSAWYFVLRTLRNAGAFSGEFFQKKNNPSCLFVETDQELTLPEKWEIWSGDRKNLEAVQEVPLIFSDRINTPADRRKQGALIFSADWESLSDLMVEQLRWSRGTMELFHLKDKGWYLRMEKPSFWSLQQNEDIIKQKRMTLYWEWEGLTSIYWPSQVRPGDFPRRQISALPPGRYVLDSASHVDILPLDGWVPLAQNLDIKTGKVTYPKTASIDKLKIDLQLLPSYGEAKVTALRFDNQQPLLEAAAHFAWEDLEQIRTWKTSKETWYIYSPVDSACWTYLKQYGKAFISRTERILIPAGTRLIPMMETETLENFFLSRKIPKAAMLVCQNNRESVEITVLNYKDEKPLTDYLQLICTDIFMDTAQKDYLLEALEDLLAQTPPVSDVAGQIPNINNSSPDELNKPDETIQKEIQRKKDISTETKKDMNVETKTNVKNVTKNNQYKSIDKPVRQEQVESKDDDLDMPEAFRMYKNLSEEELKSLKSELSRNPQALAEDQEALEKYSAVLFYLKEIHQSLLAWAQRMLALDFPEQWDSFWDHPYWKDQQLKNDFTQALEQIEIKGFPAEVHYCAVSLICLQHNEEDQFYTLQKQMYRNFFLGQQHPFGTLCQMRKVVFRVEAQWKPQAAELWQTFSSGLPKSLVGLANIQLHMILNLCGITDPAGVKTEVLSSELMRLPPGQLLQQWQSRGKISQNETYRNWSKSLSLLAGYNPDENEAEDLFFFLPPGDAVHSILSRFQRIIDQGVTNREDLFPVERSQIQIIINNQMLYDIIKVYGTLPEIKEILTPMPDEIDDTPLTVADVTLRLKLQLLYLDEKEAASMRLKWIPELIGKLNYPGSKQDQPGWLFLTAQIWQSPWEEKVQYLGQLGRKIDRLLVGQDSWDSNENIADFWLQFISLIQGTLIYNSVADNQEETQRELRRRTEWVQLARKNSKTAFRDLSKKYN